MLDRQQGAAAREVRLVKHKRMYKEQRNMLYNQTYNFDKVSFASDSPKDTQQTSGLALASGKPITCSLAALF